MLKGWKTYLVAALGAAWDLVLADILASPKIGPYWPLLMVAMRQLSNTPPGLKVLNFWERLKR
jgi:hypothetical protein